MGGYVIAFTTQISRDSVSINEAVPYRRVEKGLIELVSGGREEEQGVPLIVRLCSVVRESVASICKSLCKQRRLSEYEQPLLIRCNGTSEAVELDSEVRTDLKPPERLQALEAWLSDRTPKQKHAFGAIRLGPAPRVSRIPVLR